MFLTVAKAAEGLIEKIREDSIQEFYILIHIGFRRIVKEMILEM